MNKSKLILAAVGGVMGLAVLVMAYLVWDAYSAKVAATEGDDDNEGLETVLAKAQTLSRKPIYPCLASVKAVESNGNQIAEWKAEASKLAARGDRVYESTTPAAFKTFMVSDAKRLSALPGGVAGMLVKPDFAFGPFKDYISEGKMPSEAKLGELQRQWDDVATVVEILAQSGISELTDVQFVTKEAPKEEENTKRRGPKQRKVKQEEKPAEGPVAYSYAFTFTTRPVGFVKAINALGTDLRFINVDGFSFMREKDVLSEVLGGNEKKAEQQESRGGRRGRRRGGVMDAEQSQEDAGKLKNGIITDPLLDDPFKVVLNVTVYDFRSLEGADKSEEVKK